MDTTAARERRIMDSKAFALFLAVISLNCCRFNNIKLSVRSQIMRQSSWSPFKPYLARWNSSRKPARILTIDITTACGWVMGRLKMSIATTKHRGFGTRPRQDPRRLRSHNRRWDGGAKVSRSSDRIYPCPDSDVGRSNEVLRLLVFKIKIFKDSLCSVFRLL